MEIEIVWSEESIKTYDQNIDFLFKQWSAREVDRFLTQTDFVLSRIQTHPESSSPSKRNKKIRMARFNKYITLYYRYNKRRKQIELLSFWNTKQDPSKLKY
jgi:hypothetical protein